MSAKYRAWAEPESEKLTGVYGLHINDGIKFSWVDFFGVTRGREWIKVIRFDRGGERFANIEGMRGPMVKPKRKEIATYTNSPVLLTS